MRKIRNPNKASRKMLEADASLIEAMLWMVIN
jgi:hypothetical protein